MLYELIFTKPKANEAFVTALTCLAFSIFSSFLLVIAMLSRPDSCRNPFDYRCASLYCLECFLYKVCVRFPHL